MSPNLSPCHWPKVVSNMEYKKSCTGFNPRTRGKVANPRSTCQSAQQYFNPRPNSQQYSNAKPKCPRQNMIWFNFVAWGLTLGKNSFILNPCFCQNGPEDIWLCYFPRYLF